MVAAAAPPFFYPIFDPHRAKDGDFRVSQPWNDWFLRLGSTATSTGTDLTSVLLQIASLQLRVTALELEVAALSANYVFKYDQDSITPTLAYYGRADPGSATSAAVWQIQKLDYAVDGDAGNQWADGIDLRCRDALVSGNVVQNATDGGITVMTSPGSIIEDNLIVNDQRGAFSGILLDPVQGTDFTGTVARNNVIISAYGQHVHIGVGVGTHLWCLLDGSNGNCQMGNGASVTNNVMQSIDGGKYGFGLIVSGMDNATVQGNKFLGWVGWGTQNCRMSGQQRYVIDSYFSSATYQPGYFLRGPFYWPCVGPTH